MPITKEQALAEIARRQAMASSTQGVSQGITPEQARAEIARRQAAQQPQPSGEFNLGKSAKDVLGGALYGFSSIGRTIQGGLSRGVDKVFGTKGFGAPASKEEFQKTLGVDLSTKSGKTGQFLGEALPYVVQPQTGAVKGLAAIGGRTALNTVIGSAQTGDIKQGALIGVGGEAVGLGGKLVSQAGKGLYKTAIPLSAKEAKLVQTYSAKNTLADRVIDTLKGKTKMPVTAKETAFSKGLKGTESMIGVQSKRATDTLWKNQISPALKGVKQEVDVNSFFNEARDTIIKNNPELTRRKSLLNALDAVKDDYAGVDKVSVEKLQKLKEGWSKFVPEKVYKGENVAGSLREVQAVLAGQARNKIYLSIGDQNIRKAYIDYGNLVGLQKWGQKAMTGSKLKGGAGSYLTALKDMVVVPVGTVGGRTIYRTGNGIELVSGAGAKTINDIINSPDYEQK